MLVLGRKTGQKIRIGDQIALSIVTIRGNRVQIGIDAPTHINIRRAEIPSSKDKNEESAPVASQAAEHNG